MKARSLRNMWVPIIAGMLVFAAGTARAEHEVDYHALKHLGAKLLGEASALTDYADENFRHSPGPRKFRHSARALHDFVHEFHEKMDYYADHRVRGAKQVDELFRLAAVSRDQLRYVHGHHRPDRALAQIQDTLTQLHAVFAPPVVVRVDWNEVQSVAHQIEELSRHIYNQSRSELRYSFSWFGDNGRERAIDRLDDLKDESRHLHNIVEKGRVELRHVDGDFKDVVEAYNRASKRIHSTSYRTRRQFEQLGREISRLDSLLHDPRIIVQERGHQNDRNNGGSYGRYDNSRSGRGEYGRYDDRDASRNGRNGRNNSRT